MPSSLEGNSVPPNGLLLFFFFHTQGGEFLLFKQAYFSGLNDCQDGVQMDKGSGWGTYTSRRDAHSLWLDCAATFQAR